MPDIVFEVDHQQIATLTLNRPQVRNALSWAAMEAFAEAVERAHTLPELRALIVTGAGQSFAAGGDLSELQQFSAREDGLRLSTVMGDALARLEALPCPVIAAVNGPARGGGAEITVACDLRVLAEDASLGFVHVTLGLIPGWGGGQRLKRLVGYARALELLATARLVSAEEALRLGLANQVAPARQALAAAYRLAAQMAAYSPAAVQALKRSLRLEGPQAEALAAERAEFPPLWASEAHHEAVERFLSRK